jgi:hypothetical protein
MVAGSAHLAAAVRRRLRSVAVRASSLAGTAPANVQLVDREDSSTTSSSSSGSDLAPPTPKYGPHVTFKGYALNIIGLLFTVVR